MNASATSFSLPYGLVLEIIQKYLNTELLRAPHVVTDLDCCDRQCINVGLRLVEDQQPLLKLLGAVTPIQIDPLTCVPIVAVSALLPDLPLHIGDPSYEAPAPIGKSNGTNGHNGVTAITEHIEENVPAAAAPAAESKRRQSKYTPEQRTAVIELRTQRTKIGDIATATGVKQSQVYAILAEARRSGFNDPEYRLGAERAEHVVA